jgi:hypothetical protein
MRAPGTATARRWRRGVSTVTAPRAQLPPMEEQRKVSRDGRPVGTRVSDPRPVVGVPVAALDFRTIDPKARLEENPRSSRSSPDQKAPGSAAWPAEPSKYRKALSTTRRPRCSTMPRNSSCTAPFDALLRNAIALPREDHVVAPPLGVVDQVLLMPHQQRAQMPECRSPIDVLRSTSSRSGVPPSLPS